MYKHVIIMTVAKINDIVHLVFANEILVYHSQQHYLMSIAHCCSVVRARKKGGLFKSKECFCISYNTFTGFP